jgi:enoyl-CoA hydratase
LKNFSKPIVAAVNGFALGGGCELAMHADIIIAGESAMFGQPEVRLGIMPGSGGTQRLPRAVGKFRAMKLLLTGSPFSATEAYDMGMVSEVVEDSRAIEAAMKIAETIARQPAVAVRKIKEVVLAGLDVPLETGLLLERQALHLLFDTGDQREGMLAFLEKRKPKFSGQ